MHRRHGTLRLWLRLAGLALVLVVGFLPIGRSAAVSLPSTLTFPSWGIGSENSSSPLSSGSTVTLNPGDQFKGYYTIVSTATSFQYVGLGMSIRSGSTFSDATHDSPTCAAGPVYPPGSGPKTTLSSRLFRVPTTAPAGTYTVDFALWDGVPGGSSHMYDGTLHSLTNVVIVQQPKSDLVVQTLSYQVSRIFQVGSSYSVSTVSRNNGPATSAASTAVVVLSEDQVVGDPYDQELFRTPGPALAAGPTFTSPTGTGPLTVPIVAQNFHYLCAKADYLNNDTNESDETNNTLCVSITYIGPRPDLVVEGLSVSPTSALRGSTVTVNFTLHNIGQADSLGGSHRVYFSSDSTITTGDLFTTEVFQNLSAGQSVAKSVPVTVPATGAYSYVGVIADALKNVDEITDDNNTAATPFTILERCYTLTRTVLGGVGGRIDASPGPNCPNAGETGKYLENTPVALTAVPADQNYELVSWGGRPAYQPRLDHQQRDHDREQDGNGHLPARGAGCQENRVALPRLRHPPADNGNRPHLVGLYLRRSIRIRGRIA